MVISTKEFTKTESGFVPLRRSWTSFEAFFTADRKSDISRADRRTTWANWGTLAATAKPAKASTMMVCKVLRTSVNINNGDDDSSSTGM